MSRFKKKTIFFSIGKELSYVFYKGFDFFYLQQIVKFLIVLMFILSDDTKTFSIINIYQNIDDDDKQENLAWIYWMFFNNFVIITYDEKVQAVEQDRLR